MQLIELEEATDEQINECCRKIGDERIASQSMVE